MAFIASGEPLLLVEGVHDEGFFEALGLNRALGPFQVYVYEGKSRLRARMAALVREEAFKKVQSLGVAQDANGDPVGAWANIVAALTNAGLPVPTAPLTPATDGTGFKVTAMVMPGGGQAGALEDLALRAVIGTPAAACVDALYKCLVASGLPHEDTGKSRLHVLLATRPAFVGSIQVAFGLGLVPLGSDVFEDAAHFLQEIVS